MNEELVRGLPKALLHDHLDGGLRPSTVIELAEEFGYQGLPTHDAADLAQWFNRGAKRNDLVLYLETFAHTVGVMQHRDAVERVSYECARDLAADGVVYAEVRMAPELCTEAGMTLDEVVGSMIDGFARGAAGTDLTIYAILTAMRTAARSPEIAELAVRWRDAGVIPRPGVAGHSIAHGGGLGCYRARLCPACHRLRLRRRPRCHRLRPPGGRSDTSRWAVKSRRTSAGSSTTRASPFCS